MREAVIVSGVRTPIGKAHHGRLQASRADDMAALVIGEALGRAPGVTPDEVDDVILGCAMPEGEQGLNVARIAALRAGLPSSVPAVTVNRFCSSGLQAISMAAQRVLVGMADVIVAGGVESMSHIPMSGHRPSLNPYLVEEQPEVYMGMGFTAEEVARRFGVTRDDQDAFALESHRRAAAAADSGRFADEIVPVPVGDEELNEDEGIRRDTTLEGLAGLRPAFNPEGSVTAGNSSQMSDGAAAVVVMSRERADALGLTARATWRSFAVAGVDPDIMGIGPVEAVPKALRLADRGKEDIDLIELNEAFASQSVQVIRALELDPDIVNVNGGAIALGHPLGCTGARQTVTLMHEAERRKSRAGVVTMCIGGGMGAAAVFELSA